MITSNDLFLAADQVDDDEVRHRGIGLIDSSIPGYALLMGDDISAAAGLLDALTQRNILVFVTDEALHAGLQERGLTLGWDSGIVNRCMLQTLGFILRVAQIFGSTNSPEVALASARQRLRGFTLLLGEVTPARLAEAQAALSIGCPLISTAELPSDVDDWQILAEYTPACSRVQLTDIVQVAIEARGLQIHMPLPELPVAYSPDFSGQVVRDENCGACLTGIELTVTGQNIIDGRITLSGQDLDAISGYQPYAMLVEVSGKAMQPDFVEMIATEETAQTEEEILAHMESTGHPALRMEPML